MATGPAEDPERADDGSIENPDLGKLGEALRDRMEIRSVAITGLFVLAVFYTLYFARPFFLPIVIAVLLDFLLSPIIRVLKRMRVPESLGAALVVAGLVGLIGRWYLAPLRTREVMDGPRRRRAFRRCRSDCGRCGSR